MIRVSCSVLSGNLLLMACVPGNTTPKQCALAPASLPGIVREAMPRYGIRSPNDAAALRVEQREFRLGGVERVMVTASWGGPSNGVIVWTDCTGRALDAEASGYIIAVDSVSLAPGKGLVRVRAITGTGSGWKQESIQLYAPTEHDFPLVWSGVVAERSYQAASVGAYEETGELAYIGDDSLVYSTTRFPVSMAETGEWSRDAVGAKTRVQSYLWNSAARKYEPANNRSGGSAAEQR